MLKSIAVATVLAASFVLTAPSSVAFAQQKGAIGVPDGLQVLKSTRRADSNGINFCTSKGGTVKVDLSTCKVRTPDGGGRDCSGACFGSDGKKIVPADI